MRFRIIWLSGQTLLKSLDRLLGAPFFRQRDPRSPIQERPVPLRGRHIPPGLRMIRLDPERYLVFCDRLRNLAVLHQNIAKVVVPVGQIGFEAGSRPKFLQRFGSLPDSGQRSRQIGMHGGRIRHQM